MSDNNILFNINIWVGIYIYLKIQKIKTKLINVNSLLIDIFKYLRLSIIIQTYLSKYNFIVITMITS